MANEFTRGPANNNRINGKPYVWKPDTTLRKGTDRLGDEIIQGTGCNNIEDWVVTYTYQLVIDDSSNLHRIPYVTCNYVE